MGGGSRSVLGALSRRRVLWELPLEMEGGSRSWALSKWEVGVGVFPLSWRLSLEGEFSGSSLSKWEVGVGVGPSRNGRWESEWGPLEMGGGSRSWALSKWEVGVEVGVGPSSEQRDFSSSVLGAPSRGSSLPLPLPRLFHSLSSTLKTSLFSTPKTLLLPLSLPLPRLFHSLSLPLFFFAPTNSHQLPPTPNHLLNPFHRDPKAIFFTSNFESPPLPNPHARNPFHSPCTLLPLCFLNSVQF
jgi:hypothetical protein